MKNILKYGVFTLIIAVCACGDKSEKANNSTEQSTKQVDVKNLNVENLVKEIEKREEAYKVRKTTVGTEGRELMEAYVAYEDRFGNRENAPEYLFQAARIAMSEELTVEAIRCFDRLYNEYPKFKERPVALFYKAFVQENLAQNLDEAKVTYELFIKEYPRHEFTDDAQASLDNLGKSPEEIIRGFEIQDSINKAQS